MAFAISTAIRPTVALVGVDGCDAICRKRNVKRRAGYRHCSNGDGLDDGLPRSRSGGHLIKMSCAGERLAADGSNFGGIGAVDGHEDDAAWCSRVRTGVNDDVLHGARSGLQRSATEVGICAVESAERAEAGERIGIGAAGRPEIRRENALAAEDAKVVGLRDGSGYVVKAPVFVFRNRQLHPWIFRVDFDLQPSEDVDRTT